VPSPLRAPGRAPSGAGIPSRRRAAGASGEREQLSVSWLGDCDRVGVEL
jgi:hypothetical protein